MKNELYQFDQQFLEQGAVVLAGTDEAGRGPLAGPVYAAAVILPYEEEIEGLNDSKKLTHNKREKLYSILLEKSVSYCVASASPQEIDEINILEASLLAMRRAVEGLKLLPDYLLVDGNKNPHCGISTTTVVKGDAKSACIAAASIFAKVSRDRYMVALDQQFPGYGFAMHKGYPTKAHYAALDCLGPCPEHRDSFLRKWRAQTLDGWKS